MNFIDKLLKSAVYKIYIYKKSLTLGVRNLFKKSSHSKEVDYYEYVGETKQKHCSHKNLNRVSSTKFYCTDCGKSFHFVQEEIALLSELVGILLVGGIVYLLAKKKK
ncbi:MAG: hypothetical protein ACK4WJ_02860 [Endomicrobiia bacterium]